MPTDFENRKLKDDAGNVIKYENGEPVLYKHFLNDLPDDDIVAKVAAITPQEWVDFHIELDLPIPAELAAELKAYNKQKKK